jgi:hypothetical protein
MLVATIGSKTLVNNVITRRGRCIKALFGILLGTGAYHYRLQRTVCRLEMRPKNLCQGFSFLRNLKDFGIMTLAWRNELGQVSPH